MELFIVIALALAGLIFVAWPLFRPKLDQGLESNVEEERLRAERLRVYRRVTDLQEDRRNGNLGDVSVAEWDAQLNRLRTMAAQLLMKEDRLRESRGAEAEIEDEVVRERLRQPLSSAKGNASTSIEKDLN